jgi:hypothetical protein
MSGSGESDLASTTVPSRNPGILGQSVSTLSALLWPLLISHVGKTVQRDSLASDSSFLRPSLHPRRAPMRYLRLAFSSHLKSGLAS